MTRNTCLATLLLAAAFVGFACDREPDYTVTKQGKETPAAPQSPSAAAPLAQAKASSDLHFNIPDGWQEDPAPRPMREATLRVGQGDKSAELIVTRLASNFGGIGDNINRWRAQIGLEALQDPSSVQPRIVKTPVGDVKVYKLEGTDKASIIALVQQGEETWFFRLTGEKATVLENEPKLEQLLSSLAAGPREQA